ncbi:hypothetical protein THS27_05175 [Thalassospira sp. MCCC 1A01428]|nr:hypothetical protein THS27_05175 [Thalassospira sp. MCCC 1A01428]
MIVVSISQGFNKNVHKHVFPASSAHFVRTTLINVNSGRLTLWALGMPDTLMSLRNVLSQ